MQKRVLYNSMLYCYFFTPPAQCSGRKPVARWRWKKICAWKLVHSVFVVVVEDFARCTWTWKLFLYCDATLNKCLRFPPDCWDSNYHTSETIFFSLSWSVVRCDEIDRKKNWRTIISHGARTQVNALLHWRRNLYNIFFVFYSTVVVIAVGSNEMM